MQEDDEGAGAFFWKALQRFLSISLWGFGVLVFVRDLTFYDHEASLIHLLKASSLSGREMNTSNHRRTASNFRSFYTCGCCPQVPSRDLTLESMAERLRVVT